MARMERSRCAVGRSPSPAAPTGQDARRWRPAGGAARSRSRWNGYRTTSSPCCGGPGCSTSGMSPLSALTGGVSSDIWLVRLRHRAVCVKRALAQLRVKADWRAPVERNRYEAAWMRVAGAIVPGAVPELLVRGSRGGRPGHGLSRAEPARLWKTRAACGRGRSPDRGRRRRAARAHPCRDRARPDIAAQFPTDAIFHDIRLEPYLLATAMTHPALATPLRRIAAPHRDDQARAGPWRRQPEEHPARPDLARSFSTPNAPGTAIPPSTSPSASITSC